MCEKCGYVRGNIEVTAMAGEAPVSLTIPYRARVLEG